MAHRYYHICSSNIGRVATIRTYDGRVYSGRIGRVTESHVYFTPVGGGISGKDNKKLKKIAKNAVASEKGDKGSEIFFFFFPFAAIAALTFAAAATPFYGFGFGRRPFGRRRFYY